VNKPEFSALLESPDPVHLSAAGYRYIYASKEYWKLHASLLDQPCVNVLKTVEGSKFEHGGLVPDFRRLADISECQ
jgi:hypothetical protein